MSADGLRVLHALAGGVHGGAETFFVSLVGALQRRGVAQRPVIRRHAEREAALAALGAPARALRFGGPLDWATGRAIAAEVAAFRPDVVLSWMSRAAHHVGRARPPGVPHVARLGGYYDLKYYRGCDHLIGITPDIVAHVRRAGWPAERAHFLPNFARAEPAAAVPRAALETPEGIPLVLGIGRLHRNKGFDVLLAAMARLPDLHVWIAGEGPERRALEAEAEALGVARRLRLLGWRGDVPALIAACDAVAFPSRHEPFGTVMLEAWGHRKPLVATAASGPRWLIEPGRTGLVVPVDDADALAEALGAVLADAAFAASLVEAAYAEFRARYTEEAAASAYIALLRRLAG